MRDFLSTLWQAIVDLVYFLNDDSKDDDGEW